jgi:hypothetical protein
MLQIGRPAYGFKTNLCRHIAFEPSVETVVVVTIIERFKSHGVLLTERSPASLWEDGFAVAADCWASRPPKTNV